MARHGAHGGEHVAVADAAPHELVFDHACAARGVVVRAAGVLRRATRVLRLAAHVLLLAAHISFIPAARADDGTFAVAASVAEPP